MTDYFTRIIEIHLNVQSLFVTYAGLYSRNGAIFSLTSGPRYETVDSATHARDALQGADIYSGCCTLRVEYAKVTYHRTGFIIQCPLLVLRG